MHVTEAVLTEAMQSGGASLRSVAAGTGSGDRELLLRSLGTSSLVSFKDINSIVRAVVLGHIPTVLPPDTIWLGLELPGAAGRSPHLRAKHGSYRLGDCKDT